MFLHSCHPHRTQLLPYSQWTRLFSIFKGGSVFRKKKPELEPEISQYPVIIEEEMVDAEKVEEPIESPPSLPDNLPVMASRSLLPSIACTGSINRPRQAWLETLKTQEDVKLGMVDLHPDVFATFPRLDLIHANLKWQAKYRVVDYRAIIDRHELEFPTLKKPWPQKGTGRARQGTRRSPIFLGGGQCKGPRGPKSLFYILPESVRLAGLVSMLSVKQAQDDLHIVDDLILPPAASSDYLLDLAEQRGWGDTVLFVQKSDVAPETIAKACAEIKYFNLCPLYGLNVWSMVKHDTLVLTLDALDQLEERLLYHFTKCKQYVPVPSKKHFWDEPVGQYYSGYETDVQEHLKYQ